MIWPDRRPIAVVALSQLIPQLKIDLTLPADVARLNAAIVTLGQTVAGLGKKMNAQGFIVWDLAFEQSIAELKSVAYVGDPRLAPNGVQLDPFFANATMTGLRSGVLVRHTEVVRNIEGIPEHVAGNGINTVCDKAKYAHDRWGSTLFYVDSNNLDGTTPTGGAAASLVARFKNAGVDALPVWEQTSPDYSGWGWRYWDARDAHPFVTNPSIPALIGQSWNAPAGRDWQVAAVKAGNVLDYEGWYAGPAMTYVAGVYHDAQVPGF